MEYQGKLYGKVGKSYFPLIETTEDFDNLKKEKDELIGCLKNIVDSIKFLPSNELLGLETHENYYNVLYSNLDLLEETKEILRTKLILYKKIYNQDSL